MLRGNLSTRPFYNERLVSLALAGIAILGLALAAFNASELVRLSRERSDLAGRAERDEAQAQRIETQAAAIQKAVDNATLRSLAGATSEANEKIDQRTFSWTTFFGLLEKTMPMDLRLVAVSPKVDKGEIKVTMIVVAKQWADINTFIGALNDTGMFYDVVPKGQESNDDGTFNAAVEAYYFVAPSPGTAKNRKGRP